MLIECAVCQHPRLLHDSKGCHARGCGPDRAELRCRRFVDLAKSSAEARKLAAEFAREGQGELFDLGEAT